VEKQDIEKLIIEKFNMNGNGVPFCSKDKTRITLAELFGELGFKVGVELGVWQGWYSATLFNSVPGLHLLCIDPWHSFRRHAQRKMEMCYERTCKRLRHKDVEIIRKPSLEAIRDVPDKSLDFVYIDEMHEFDPVMADLILWNEKIRSGGIMSGHDYSPPTWYNGVMLAVDTYTKAHDINPWFITSEPSSDHEAPSFFWVKK